VALDGTPRILIVGASYGGMHTALRLGSLLRPGEATVTVADRRQSASRRRRLVL
jgi:NADH dehydrogenase FAD-containing subunit